MPHLLLPFASAFKQFYEYFTNLKNNFIFLSSPCNHTFFINFEQLKMLYEFKGLF